MEAEVAREIIGKVDSLANAAILWTAAPIALLALVIAGLAALARMRARSRRMEKWFEGELAQLRRQVEALQESNSPKARPGRPVKPPPQRLRREDSASPGAELVERVNGLLAGNQPYNFIESIRAMDALLPLQRLTPAAGAGAFSQEIVLENGGDSLFACIRGNTALLFPNYSRFSATLDPRPLFDGARHGGRIHSVTSPAVLKKTDDGAWLLIEKGRVQMRQGGENT